MHNKPVLQLVLAPGLVHEPRLNLSPMITPRLRRTRDPDAPRPEVGAEAPPWRERRAAAAARRRGSR